MKPVLLWAIPLIFLSCSGSTNQKAQVKSSNTSVQTANQYVWTKLLDNGPWAKSYNFQMFACRDTLWVFHSDGNWFSADGTNWTKSPLTNCINNLAFLDYVQFNDAVYGLGHFEGNIERFNFKPQIYKTTNFRTWDTVAHESNLPRRFFYHPFVFNNQLWIIGGEDKNSSYADLWSSSDAIHWVKRKDNLPFGKRSGSQVVLFKEKLYLLDHDVWSSTDALNWQRETPEILKGEEQFGGTAVVYDNKLWLLACNRNGRFQSKVFVSEDGRQWQGEDAPWTPRGAVAAAVFKNKIYLTGGKYGGLMQDGATTEFVYSNDLWVMGRKE